MAWPAGPGPPSPYPDMRRAAVEDGDVVSAASSAWLSNHRQVVIFSLTALPCVCRAAGRLRRRSAAWGRLAGGTSHQGRRPDPSGRASAWMYAFSTPNSPARPPRTLPIPASGPRRQQPWQHRGCILILLFAAIGRDAHQRGEIITGVLRRRGRSWQARHWHGWPCGGGISPAGVARRRGCLARNRRLGDVLRPSPGRRWCCPHHRGPAEPAVFLLGYRLVAAGVRRLRSRRRQA